MLKLLAFVAVASTVSVALTVYLLDIWADIKNFRTYIKSAEEKKRAYAFLLDAVVKTLVYFIAVVVLPAVLRKIYN